MFEGIRRLFKPSMSREEKERDALTARLAVLEKSVNERTRDLKKEKTQLEQLSDNGEVSQKDEAEAADAILQKVQPKGELLLVEDKDLSFLLEKTDEEEQKGEKGEGNTFAGLFVQEEEEANPLRNLIDSLANVTAEELVKQAKAIKTMLLERERSL